MIEVADILQRLQALTSDDRTWILGKLPAAAKSTLLAAASAEPSPPPATAPTLAPRSVAAALKEEPAWLAAAFLQGAADPWAAEVIGHLPAVLRSDVANLRRAESTLTPLSRQTLADLLHAHVGQSAPPPTPSKFHTLLERLSASRSRKRMTLHL